MFYDGWWRNYLFYVNHLIQAGVSIPSDPLFMYWVLLLSGILFWALEWILQSFTNYHKSFKFHLKSKKNVMAADTVTIPQTIPIMKESQVALLNLFSSSIILPWIIIFENYFLSSVIFWPGWTGESGEVRLDVLVPVPGEAGHHLQGPVPTLVETVARGLNMLALWHMKIFLIPTEA